MDFVRAIYSGEKQHAYLVWGRRTGKSFAFLYLANLLICKHWNEIYNVIIFCELKSQSREIFSKNVTDDGQLLLSILPHGTVYSAYNSEIVYPNGSTISFAGVQNIDTERGKRGKTLMLDEFALYSHPIETFYPFLQDHKKSNIIVATTPRGKNHAYDLKLYAQEHKSWYFTELTSIDLGLLTMDEYNEMPGDKNFLAQEYLCSWDSANAGAIYSTPNVKYGLLNNKNQVYCGVDLGRMSDATAFVFAQLDGMELKIIMTREYVGMLGTEVLLQVKSDLNKYGIDLNMVTFFLPHDGEIRNEVTGLSRIDMFRQFGLKCITSPMKGIMEGIDLVRSMWHNIVWDGDKDKSFNGIETIKQYVRGVDNRPDTSKSAHKFTHIPDGLRYLCVGLESKRLIQSWKERVDYVYTQYSRYSRKI